jgi:hypothetical protein
MIGIIMLSTGRTINDGVFLQMLHGQHHIFLKFPTWLAQNDIFQIYWYIFYLLDSASMLPRGSMRTLFGTLRHFWHSCLLMDPTKFCPFFTTSCLLMDPNQDFPPSKSHVFWWTQLVHIFSKFSPLKPHVFWWTHYLTKTSCLLMDPKPHVF